MKYKIAICDDMEKDAQAMALAVNRWAQKEKVLAAVRTFPCAEEFLFQYEEEKDYHILLLDVEMRGMSGIELAKKIRRENDRVEIIFVTSHFEFSGEGYEVDALHYLVKPVAQDKLMEVLSKAARRLAEEPASLTVACEGEIIRLFEADILYIEAFLHYIVIHAKRGMEPAGKSGAKNDMYSRNPAYKIKENISSFAGRLSSGAFYRTHRSYLVSLRHVVRISRTSVLLDNGAEVPLARGKYDGINRAFIEHG